MRTLCSGEAELAGILNNVCEALGIGGFAFGHKTFRLFEDHGHSNPADPSREGGCAGRIGSPHGGVGRGKCGKMRRERF